MNENQTIKDTLSIIRKALEDEDPVQTDSLNDDILVLNQIVKDDGTIITLKGGDGLNKKDTLDTLHRKLDEIFEDHLSGWLDKNIPKYLEKYFKKKDI